MFEGNYFNIFDTLFNILWHFITNKYSSCFIQNDYLLLLLRVIFTLNKKYPILLREINDK